VANGGDPSSSSLPHIKLGLSPRQLHQKQQQQHQYDDWEEAEYGAESLWGLHWWRRPEGLLVLWVLSAMLVALLAIGAAGGE
jgi:hypothetical protein